MKKISVIIPVYNVEKYLTKAIDSVIEQDVEETEILLIDDGSTDASVDICDNYAEKYENIQVIHKVNEGLGYARNEGLNIAEGEYILFLDSDDWLEKNCLSYLYNDIKKTDADLLMFGMIREGRSNGQFKHVPIKEGIYDTQGIHRNILLPIIGGTYYEKYTEQIRPFVCQFLYKRKLFDNIRFLSERVYYTEDILFTLQCLYKANKLFAVDKGIYHYRINAQSLTQTYKPQTDVLLINQINKISQFAEQVEEDGITERIYWRWLFYISKYTIFNLSKARGKQTIREKKKIFSKLVNRKEIQLAMKNVNSKKQMPLKNRWLLFVIKRKNYILAIMAFRLYGFWLRNT